MTTKVHQWIEGLSEEQTIVALTAIRRAAQILSPVEKAIFEASIKHPDSTNIEVARTFKEEIIADSPEANRETLADWRNEKMLAIEADNILNRAENKIAAKFPELADILIRSDNMGQLNSDFLPFLTSKMNFGDSPPSTISALAKRMKRESGDDIETVLSDLGFFPSFLDAVAAGEIVPDEIMINVMCTYCRVGDRATSSITEDADQKRADIAKGDPFYASLHDLLSQAFNDTTMANIVSELFPDGRKSTTTLTNPVKFEERSGLSKNVVNGFKADKTKKTEPENIDMLAEGFNAGKHAKQLLQEINAGRMPRRPFGELLDEHLSKGTPSLAGFISELLSEWKMSQVDFVEPLGIDSGNFRTMMNNGLMENDTNIRRIVETYGDIETDLSKFRQLAKGMAYGDKEAALTKARTKLEKIQHDDAEIESTSAGLAKILYVASGIPRREMPSSFQKLDEGAINLALAPTVRLSTYRAYGQAFFPDDPISARRTENALMGIGREYSAKELINSAKAGEMTGNRALRTARMLDRQDTGQYAANVPFENKFAPGDRKKPGIARDRYAEVERGSVVLSTRNEDMGIAIAKRMGLSRESDIESLTSMLQGSYEYPKDSPVVKIQADLDEQDATATPGTNVEGVKPLRATKKKLLQRDNLG